SARGPGAIAGGAVLASGVGAGAVVLTSGSAFAVVASPFPWRGTLRGSVLAVLMSSRGAAGGMGSLPAPNSGGNEGRRVSGRESLTSSTGTPGALAASRARASDPGATVSAAAADRVVRDITVSLTRRV